MDLFMTLVRLALLAALVPFALDWRSPELAGTRSWALLALIVLPLGLIALEAWTMSPALSRSRSVRILRRTNILLATLAIISVVVLEGRYYWYRHRVLTADTEVLERLGRHLIVGYRDIDEVRSLVRHRAIAGVFLSARNARNRSAEEIGQEIRSLQAIREEQELPPLWISTDQEGGLVSRLSPPLSRSPSLTQLVADHHDPIRRRHEIVEYARTQGRELASVGVNLNLAPVVDINYHIVNPHDRYTRIHQRAISADPRLVTEAAGWYCDTLELQAVRCTLKHFPGLGRVYHDTHAGSAELVAEADELTASDWVPFRTLMSKNKLFVMLSHVKLTAIDPVHTVSTSKSVVNGILRKDWKYDGVLITDDFSMQAVYRDRGGVSSASVRALNAGVDLILVSWDVDQYYSVMHALMTAEREGELHRENLQHSTLRLNAAQRSLAAVRDANTRLRLQPLPVQGEPLQRDDRGRSLDASLLELL